MVRASAQQVGVPSEKTAKLTRLEKARLSFAFKLFSLEAKKAGTENLFFSPYSLYSALEMVYQGAQGETKRAMSKSLEARGIPIEELPQSFQAKRADLITSRESEVKIANSLWVTDFAAANPDFFQDCQCKHRIQNSPTF